jgi:hypothetical protein
MNLTYNRIRTDQILQCLTFQRDNTEHCLYAIVDTSVIGDPIGSIEFYNHILPTTIGIQSTTVVVLTSIGSTYRMTSMAETTTTAQITQVTNSTSPAPTSSQIATISQSTTWSATISEGNYFPGPETFVPMEGK